MELLYYFKKPLGDERRQLVNVHIASAMLSQNTFRSFLVLSVTRTNPEQKASFLQLSS